MASRKSWRKHVMKLSYLAWLYMYAMSKAYNKITFSLGKLSGALDVNPDLLSSAMKFLENMQVVIKIQGKPAIYEFLKKEPPEDIHELYNYLIE